MKNLLKKLAGEIYKSKSLILVTLIALSLLIPSFLWSSNKPQKEEKVLGVTNRKETPSPSPSPSVSPSPKASFIAYVAPTPSPSVASTSTPTPTPSSSSSSSSTPTPTPTPTPSPTPVGLNIHIGINYAGQKSEDSYPVSVEPGKTAWDAIVQAIGIDNIQYDSYSFGNFITGLNGVSADPNSQYYEFRINGASASVGVSDYVVSDNDQLDFVLTTF